jgi:NADPH2:quinone reductase
MKAIQITEYGGPEVLRYVDLPKPTPQPGQVLIRVHVAGVGKPDVLLRTGVYKWKPPLPTVLGAEASGVIEAVGEGVTGFSPGDPVLALYGSLGCYAQYVLAPSNKVFPLPRGFDLDAAIHIPNYITAYALLTDAAAGTTASTLYVNGSAGGLGIALIQLARRRGLTVIAGASSDEKCAFVQRHGANHTVNYGKQNVVAEVLRLTNGRGAGLIYDQLIGSNFTDSLDMLAPLGMVISFNALLGLPEKNLFAEMRGRLGRSPAVRCFSGHVYEDDPARLREIHAEVVQIFQEGGVSPVVYATLPLAEAQRAHQMLDAREVLGKLVLAP